METEHLTTCRMRAGFVLVAVAGKNIEKLGNCRQHSGMGIQMYYHNIGQMVLKCIHFQYLILSEYVQPPSDGLLVLKNL